MSNPFFNQFTDFNEQKLIQELSDEAIAIYSHDVYYLPRTGINLDTVLNEYEYSEFNDACQVEMYINTISGFEGDGVLLSKFGMEIRDQVILTVSVNTFSRDVMNFTTLTRPREGDLIWIPFLQALYEIRYVENTHNFFQFGSIQSFQLVTELFEFSQEVFNTGIAEIDEKYGEEYGKRNILDEFNITDEDGNILTDELDNHLVYDEYDVSAKDPGSDNFEIESEGDELIDWSERNPFGEI